MADTPEYAAAPDPFETAVADLAARLRELGATPQQATQAAVETVAKSSLTRPSRMQPPDQSGTTAGQYGLPPLVDYSSNALAGPEMRSTNTPLGDMIGAYDTGLGALASKAERGAGYVTRGAAELTGVPQAMRAGDALGDALIDPSLANVTNAGTQAALAVGRPLAAAGALGAGYLTAGAKDLGMLDIAANAQQPKAQAKTRPGLTPELNAEYDALERKISTNNFISRSDANIARERLRQLQDLSNKSVMMRLEGNQTAETDKKLKAQKEYDDAVQGANTRLSEDKQRAKDQNFYETEVGKLYKKTGVITPGVAAVGVGVLTRAVGGGMPAALGWGGLTGGMAANYPLLHNTYYQDAYNPEKAAYAAYARDLPPDHPRKAEWDAYAKALPDQNPAQRIAQEQLTDPTQLMMRTGLGVAEGALGGHIGDMLMKIPVNAARTAWNRLAGSEQARAEQRSSEAASRETNALARSPGVDPTAAVAVPMSSTASFEPNVLATGNLAARSARTPDVALSAPGQSLGSEALSNRPPSEILKAIQPAPRQVPTTFQPKATEAAYNAADDLPKGMVRRGDGVIYWEAGTGKGGNPVDKSILKAMGLKNEKPATTSNPKQGRSDTADDIPEKPSVQIDDMAPMGRRRPSYDE